MTHSFCIDLNPVAHILLLWKINIPVGLQELLYKHVSSSLPIGRMWHGSLSLGQFCQCGAELSLHHLWASCPDYNLLPLLLTVYSHFISLHHGPGLSAKPWLWPPPFWYPLLAFHSLDCIPNNDACLHQTLGKSHAKREWALGSFLWFVWKQHMKEVHNSSYCFIPGLHVDALSIALSEEPTLTSHPC